MKITIVAATKLEIEPLLNQYGATEAAGFSGLFIAGDDLHFLVTGIGMLNTAARLMYYACQQDRDLYIDAGIAGAFNRNFPINSVYQVASETYGDFGVENDENFEDFFEMGFIDKAETVFEYGLCKPIVSDVHSKINLPTATSITVNRVHGNAQTIAMLESKYRADIENMEGLAFYYVLQMLGKPGIEIRSISNYVERRNKENWDINGAVSMLNSEVENLLQAIRL
jgi:futalosine hydrolase